MPQQILANFDLASPLGPVTVCFCLPFKPYQKRQFLKRNGSSTANRGEYKNKMYVLAILPHILNT
jgi:hypothetical protein